MIEIVLLAFILKIQAIFLGILCICLWQAKRLKDIVIELITPEKEGELSPIAKVYDLMVDRFLDKALMKFNAVSRGIASGEARAEKALMSDLVESMVEAKNPLIKVALDKVIPKWRKKLVKNPEAILPLLNLLPEFGKFKDDDTDKSSYSDNLAKYS